MDLVEFIDTDALLDWLEVNDIDKRPYKVDTYDCDDYAIDLVRAARAEGYEIFMCGSDTHAYNVAHINGEWYYIEPQTDYVLYIGEEL